MPTTANLALSSGVQASEAMPKITRVPGVRRVIQVHPGDEDEHYARMYVVEIEPEQASDVAFFLAGLAEVESIELNAPRKVSPPSGHRRGR